MHVQHVEVFQRPRIPFEAFEQLHRQGPSFKFHRIVVRKLELSPAPEIQNLAVDAYPVQARGNGPRHVSNIQNLQYPQEITAFTDNRLNYGTLIYMPEEC